MRSASAFLAAGFALWALSACAPDEPPTVTFHGADAYPERLSAWGVLHLDADADRLLLASDSVPYALNTSLFTDYALKLRTLHVPAGAAATYEAADALSFPVGTVVSKTFFYRTGDGGALRLNDAPWSGAPADDALELDRVRLMETRLLVRQADGWDALPYVWRGDDAFLAITGDLMTLPVAPSAQAVSASAELNYVVPSRNQCASCHAENHSTGELLPLGLKARHVNRAEPHTAVNQLESWSARGWLAGLPEGPRPRNAALTDVDATLEQRARAYLDINCGHCHNERGAADTSGLLLDYATQSMAALGQCKAPIAAGRGSGGRLYSIVPGRPDESILTFRMQTTDPAAMMPELGRTLVHHEGLALVSEWIGSLEGQCL